MFLTVATLPERELQLSKQTHVSELLMIIDKRLFCQSCIHLVTDFISIVTYNVLGILI